MDARARSQAAKINYVGGTAGSSPRSSLQRMVRTLKRTRAADIGRILREVTPLSTSDENYEVKIIRRFKFGNIV